ncbi:hypothetical protein, partial [Variovorax sp. WDL1]
RMSPVVQPQGFTPANTQGIVQLALPIVSDALNAGQLALVLDQFPLAPRWVKIMVPSARLELVRVKLLFDGMAAQMMSAEPV